MADISSKQIDLRLAGEGGLDIDLGAVQVDAEAISFAASVVTATATLLLYLRRRG